MAKKFDNKYRVPSARLQTWDYGWNGAYFITICTENRDHFFGEIRDGKMNLTPIGAIADVLWHEIKHHAKNVELGEFVVMPNHIHGILVLNGNDGDNCLQNNEGNCDVKTMHAVETMHALSLQLQPTDPEKTIGQQRFQNQGKNTISSIVGSYKSAVTRHSRRLGFSFGWQARFHDHIIRDEKSFDNISNYIRNNPENWKEDRFFG